jgi:hypothetical protein
MCGGIYWVEVKVILLNLNQEIQESSQIADNKLVMPELLKCFCNGRKFSNS